MIHVFVGLTLSVLGYLIGDLGANYFGDYSYPIPTWFVSFCLPLWSIITIGYWNDLGREIFKSNSESPMWLQSTRFILWMSFIFTAIVWFHLNLGAIQMLVMIPILGIPLREWFVRTMKDTNWASSIKKEASTVFGWFILSYHVYWLITICWIVFRVWLLDLTSDGVIYFIQ